MEEQLTIKTEVEGAKKTEKELKAIADATNKADAAAENYENTLVDAAREQEIFGVSINGVTSGLKNVSTAFKGATVSAKALTAALAASGIGLIVVAVGTLTKAFAETQKGMDLLEDATTRLSVAWRELSSTALELFNIAEKLFAGEISFSEAWDEGAEAVSDYVDNVKEATTANLAANTAQRDLDAEQRKYIATLAEQNAELAKLKRTGEDVQVEIGQRIEATEKARQIIEEQGERAVEFAERQLEIERQRLAGKILTDEEEQKIFELEAQVFDARAEAYERDIEFQNKYNGLLKEAQALRQQEIATVQAQGLVTAGLTAEQAKQVSSQLVGLDRINKAQQENTDDAVAGSFQELIADANKGIVKTFASVPFPLNLILGGAATALFSALINQARTKISEVSGGIFEDGGMINGNSHAQGGVLIEAEGGEAVINKRSMANPRLRAMASAINVAGGGVPFFEQGGIVPNAASPFDNLSNAIRERQTVLVLEDLNTVQDRVTVRDELATL